MLAILGAGSHSNVVADIAMSSGYNNICFFDDRFCPTSFNCHELGFAIEGTISTFFDNRSFKDCSVFVALGDPFVRDALLRRLFANNFNVPVLLHPSAYVSSLAVLSPGSLVCPMSVVNVSAHIGFGSIINTQASVDHHCSLSSCVHVCPGTHLAGGVVIGSRTTIGIGSSVKQDVKIGSNVTIGAGSLVLHDVPNGVTSYGAPARIISHN